MAKKKPAKTAKPKTKAKARVKKAAKGGASKISVLYSFDPLANYGEVRVNDVLVGSTIDALDPDEVLELVEEVFGVLKLKYRLTEDHEWESGFGSEDDEYEDLEDDDLEDLDDLDDEEEDEEDEEDEDFDD